MRYRSFSKYADMIVIGIAVTSGPALVRAETYADGVVPACTVSEASTASGTTDQKCLSESGPVPRPAPSAASGACRHPSHGVERYGREFHVSRTSEWRGGGYNPIRFCHELIASLRGEYPQAELIIVASEERSESKCKPFDCWQHEYRCTVHARAYPIYVEKVSAACR